MPSLTLRIRRIGPNVLLPLPLGHPVTVEQSNRPKLVKDSFDHRRFQAQGEAD